MAHSSNVVSLPVRLDVKRPPRRMPRKRFQGVTPLHSGYAAYLAGGRIDDDQPATAIPLYESAVESARSSGDSVTEALTLTNLGNCYHRTGRSRLATECYEKAVALETNCPEALYNLGYVHLQGGRYLEAIALFERALALDASFSDCWFNLAEASFMIDRPLQAARAWKRYLELAGENDGEWSGMARRSLDKIVMGG